MKMCYKFLNVLLQIQYFRFVFLETHPVSFIESRVVVIQVGSVCVLVKEDGLGVCHRHY